MNNQTLTALKASIKKWEKNASSYEWTLIKTGPEDCPLCELFIGKNCVGCPISKKTGYSFCIKTPYDKADDFANLKNLPAFKVAALEEVTFLKSLLPNEAKP